ncbi:hypothetical protein [Actinocorallia aurantiaca]|uniref:DUF5671 domain-containing protein n=1 Tax=Actinocorallia aurantiaca TaxID=46204 RepID=A0ABN3U4E2_9ACTN
MTEQETRKEPEPKPLMARLAPIIGIVAPTTLVTALLLYFGYLSTQARFRYFGADLDLINLTTTDLLFYGSDAVFAAVVVLALAVLFGAGVYLAGKWLVSEPRRDAAVGWTSLALLYLGLLLLVGALVGIFTKATLTNRPIEVPLALMLSALMLRYSLWLWQARVADREKPLWTPPPEAVDLIRGALLVLLIAGLFWMCALASSLYGGNRAADMVKELRSYPGVLLYTRDAIDSPPVGVTYTDLGKKQSFRHRYHGLRLLAESDGRLFLVPVRWSPTTSRVLVVENSSDTRLQLIPPKGSHVRR